MKRRRRLGADVWRELVARQATSGLTVQAFCTRESVSQSGFYRWRGLLAGDAVDKPRSLAASRPTQPASDFIDLGSLSESRGRPIELRLNLGSGVRLQLVCG